MSQENQRNNSEGPNDFRLRVNAGTRGNRSRRNSRLDIQRLGGRHEWDTAPVQHPSFESEVRNAQNRRPDMHRFAQLVDDESEQRDCNAWSLLTQQHTWFRIPSMINSARTFVREELEAYYVNGMATFIEKAQSPEWVGGDG